jgi:hypothetical protein
LIDCWCCCCYDFDGVNQPKVEDKTIYLKLNKGRIFEPTVS